MTAGKSRTQTWLALIVVAIGLLPTAILGLFMYMNATATPLHPSYCRRTQARAETYGPLCH